MSAIGPSEHMRDHWWWRPGWRVGRRMYTWHVTFDGQTQLHSLVRAYQEVLKPLPGLDLIPAQWLHLTMQGIAFTDEIDEQYVRDIADAARKRLESQPPVPLTIGPAIVDPEAVMMEPQPAATLNPVRSSIRAAIGDVLGAARVPESEEWAPHISLAYSNSRGLAAPFIEAITSAGSRPVDLTISAVQLIELNRDTHLYQWVTKAEVPLAG